MRKLFRLRYDNIILDMPIPQRWEDSEPGLITFTWTRVDRNIYNVLQGIQATGVEQFQTWNGNFKVIANPGAKSIRLVSRQENPVLGITNEVTRHWGVIHIISATLEAGWMQNFTMLFYKVDPARLFIRRSMTS